MQRRDINAADAPAPAGQYTQAVEVTGATRTLYLSGQVGVSADGSIPEDAEAAGPGKCILDGEPATRQALFAQSY